MLRDWTNSDKMNSVSIQAERFFVRLIMKVDDYGCFYADTRLLKANLFPLLIDTIREADLLRWMAECQKAGLIVLYECDSKRYLQIVDFDQRLRQKKLKFPLPENMTAECGHLTDNSPPEEKEKKKEKEKGREGPLANSNLYRQPVIPTKEDVLQFFQGAGGNFEMAEKFFNKWEGVGWFANGSPITNFRNLAIGFIATWKQNESKNAVSNKKSGLTGKSGGAAILSEALKSNFQG